MRDLISKLPTPNQTIRDPHISDQTIGAVLGIFWEVVRSSLELTKLLHESGGTDRLRSLAKSYPLYGKRVCKYATQVNASFYALFIGLGFVLDLAAQRIARIFHPRWLKRRGFLFGYDWTKRP